MKALRVDGPGEYGLIEMSKPEPGPDEVLVRVVAAGISGGDMELLRGTRPATLVRYPVIPGHEWSGVIAEVGAEVRGFAAGDPVVVEGHQYCGECEFCRAGATNLCVVYNELGFAKPGAFGEYVCTPARYVHSIPGSVPLDVAALVEPLACAAQAIFRVSPTPDGVYVVIGPGPTGLLALPLLQTFRPRAVILAGTRNSAARLRLGLQLGATHTAGVEGDELGVLLYELAGERGVDLVVEAAGSATAVEQGIDMVRRGGAVSLIGLAGGGAQLTVPSDIFALKEITVAGSFGYTTSTWARAVELLPELAPLIAPIITHSFPLEQYEEAFATAQNGREAAKVLLKPGKAGTP